MFKIKKYYKKSFSFLNKLTVVDYLLIIIVLLGMIIVYKFFNPDQKWINATILGANIPIFQAYSLHIGDIEKSPSGEKTAEITDLQIYDTPDNLSISKTVYINSKLLVKINPRSKELEYKNKIIKVGSPIDMRFNSGLISGVVADMEGALTTKSFVTKTITVKVYEQWPWLADNIKLGEGELNEKGQKIVEVLSKEVKPAEITVDTAGGDRLLKIDPQKVDITLKLRIQLQKINDQYVFRKDRRIIIGESFSFNAGETKVKEGLISNIE